MPQIMEHVLERKRHHRLIRVVVVLGVATGMLLQCIGAWQDSQTTDEAVHLSAGVVYWRSHYYFLNPEHPPLVKMLAAIPLTPFAWLNLPKTFDPNVETNEWVAGATMLYRSSQNLEVARWLMFFGRIPMICLWGLLAYMIWVWSKRWWGDLGAALSTLLFVFDPTFLGHGHLVTTDVGASLGFVATLFFLHRLLEKPSRKNYWIFGIVFALTQLAKFSSLILWLIVPAIILWEIIHRKAAHPLQVFWKVMGVTLLSCMALTWIVYSFELRAPIQDPRIQRLWQEQRAASVAPPPDQPPLIAKLVDAAELSTSTGKFFNDLSATTIPAYSYWRGVFAILSHNYFGHGAFLWGEYSITGWWWYFPVTILFKTPLLTLGLFAAGGFGLFWRKRKFKQWPRSAVWILLPSGIYLLWSMTSHINIGVRHILPIYPLLYIGLGGLVLLVRDRWKLWVTSTIVLISAIVAVAAYPNTIGYFNALAGGTKGGDRYLLDSNLDWNQDIWRLREWLDQEKITDYHLVLFGSIPTNVIFPEAQNVLLDQDIRAGIKPEGWVIISAGQLYNVPGPFHWLQSKTPFKRIGSSIFIYRF